MDWMRGRLRCVPTAARLFLTTLALVPALMVPRAARAYDFCTWTCYLYGIVNCTWPEKAHVCCTGGQCWTLACEGSCEQD